jgi:hypothetical protein
MAPPVSADIEPMANELVSSVRARSRRVPWRRRFVTVLGALAILAGATAAWQASLRGPSASTDAAPTLATAVDQAVQSCLAQNQGRAYETCATQSTVTTIAPRLARSFGEAQARATAASVRTLHATVGGYELSVGIRRRGVLHEFLVTRTGDAVERSCRPIDPTACADGTW